MMTLLKVNLSSNHTHGLLLPDTALPQQTCSLPPDVALPHKRKMPKRKSKFGKGATRGGNQMQQVLWPGERMRVQDFVIDMLFEYEDNDGSTLMWCQGKVVDFIREVKVKHVFVKIEGNDKHVRDGDSKVTKKQLKKTKWNPNTPVGGAWREDLCHKLMNSE